jgi:ABC-type Fe3+ transport system substrate-binding protein
MRTKGFVSFILVVTCLMCDAGLSDAAPSGPLAQVIEGAKKEGTVSVKLKSGINQASISRLEKEVREKFGVSLQIQFAPSENMLKELSQAIMEQKAGAPPTSDLLTLEPAIAADGIKAGVLEKVNWEALLPEGVLRNAILGTPPQDERLYGYGLIAYSGRIGLMYNPEKVAARDVPKTFIGLADPKWKGRTALFTYVDAWALRAFAEGNKEKMMNDLRAVLKNGAVRGRYADEYNRYLLGEVWLAFISTSHYKLAMDKGAPVAWQSIEPVQLQEYSMVLTKGMRHPNAAKLVALYLAGPEGAKFVLEEGGAGNYLYPGNFEYDLHQQEIKQGLRNFSSSQSRIADFVRSEDYGKWTKDFQLLFDTTKDR